MSETAQRVPAWKRLGLKLKFAKDTADHGSPAKENVPSLKVPAEPHAVKPHVAAKRTLEHSPAETPPKRQKQSSQASEQTTGFGQTATPLKTAPLIGPGRGFQKPQGGAPAATPKHIVFDDPESQQGSRRKSVAFTPETKAEDGLGAVAYVQAWSAGQKTGTSGEESGVSSAVSGTSGEESGSPSQPSHKPNPQKAQKEKPATASKPARETPTDPQHAPSYVRYLESYDTDRDNWKFNKNKQTALFKNLYNFYRLPPHYNSAIVEYIQGLQGEGPRKQLIDEAEAILDTFIEANKPDHDSSSSDEEEQSQTMPNTPARREAEYAAALKRQIQRYEASGAHLRPSEYADNLLEDMRDEEERAKRAGAIMEEILHPKPVTPRTNADKGTQITPGRFPARENAHASASGVWVSEPSDPMASRVKKRTSMTVLSHAPEGPKTVKEALAPTPMPRIQTKKTYGGVQKPVPFDKELLDKFYANKNKKK